MAEAERRRALSCERRRPPPLRAEAQVRTFGRGRVARARRRLDERSGAKAAACAHQADTVELGLLARALGRALADLVALVEQLDLLQFLERLAERGLGIVELALEL